MHGFAKIFVVEAAKEVHLHHAAILRHSPQHVVGHIPRCVHQGPRRRVRRDHRSFRRGNRVPKSLVGDVRDVDHHAEPVHLQHDLLAEISETVMMLHLGIVDVARGVGPFIRVRPRKRHVPNSKPIVVAQQVDIVLDRVSAFDSHQRREFMLLVSALDVAGENAIIMRSGWSSRLLIHRINQVERVLRESGLGWFQDQPRSRRTPRPDFLAVPCRG